MGRPIPEVIQGKASDKKIVIAQEIAFAKVLAGNNKTLRDRALKKLTKWLTIRGNGKWAFTEDEFIRIWTGLFYCMWMSDKFLIQEELAENISQLIHCFRKNQENALEFIKCFHKRLLMDYEGLDQYRMDKFHMLIRRFLRQSLLYCKRTKWDQSFLTKLMDIYQSIILNVDSGLGFVLHFANIYPEEVAKVGNGKLQNEVVLKLITPFLKLLSCTKDDRIRKVADGFFAHLMRQTDAGLEFEEKFHVWKKLGFPGTSINCIQREPVKNGKHKNEEKSVNGFDSPEDDDDEEYLEKPLDPRAGSLHVDLPQIPIDFDGIINLFNSQQFTKSTNNKGRRRIRFWIEKFSTLKKGRFPIKLKKNPILDEKVKKKRLTHRNAAKLLEFTEKLHSGPIKTKALKLASKQLHEYEKSLETEENGNLEENSEEEKDEEVENEENEVEESEGDVHLQNKDNSVVLENNDIEGERESGKNKIEVEAKTKEIKNSEIKSVKNKKKKKKNNKVNLTSGNTNFNELKINKKEDKIMNNGKEKTLKKQLKRKLKEKKPQACENTTEKREKLMESPKTPTNQKIKVLTENVVVSSNKKQKNKRKTINNWQVQEIDEDNPEYNKLKPQKKIKLEVKTGNFWELEENGSPEKKEEVVDNDKVICETKKKELFIPAFWDKAKAKAFKNNKSNKSPVFVNPFAVVDNGSRRISFALDKNMAQENHEYLEEVKNSPKVPFDKTKKPIQSALKSGLAPSPINPFYKIRKIRF